jgi:hypothetical protein
MSSMFTLGGVALVVVGGLALWYFNKPESQEKEEETATSNFEETNQEVN